MRYSNKLRKLFAGITLHEEDLLLLEAFQIKYFPDRVPTREFAALLHAHPVIKRFFLSKYPPIESFIKKVQSEHKPIVEKSMIEEYCQELLWEIADLIIFNKYPEVFDNQIRFRWDIREITSITPLEGKVVADVGAGSGRIAFLVAKYAETVFAVEPTTSFRRFMKEKAKKESLDNLWVIDGFLHSIPLPDHTLDLLITSNAIGWNLKEELVEIERVLKSGAYAIHLIKSDAGTEHTFHDILVSPAWDYSCTRHEDDQEVKLKYFKFIH